MVYKKWIKKGGNTFIPTDESSINPELDSGVYDMRVVDGIGFYMVKKDIHLDDLLEFPSNKQTEVIGSIKEFWKKKAKFLEYGFAFKRGILLHGKAGSGKTCTLNLAIKYCVEQLKGIVIPITSPHDLALFNLYIAEVIRVIEPDRPIIVTIEDIEGLCHSVDIETQLLNVLDGIDQLENVVYLATTNYIEKLKERIINRPSRFDRRIYIPFLSYEDRKYYFTNKIKNSDINNIDMHEWCTETEGMSVAHLAEVIKSVLIFEHSFTDTIAVLKEMQEFSTLNSINYEKQQGKIGFNKLPDHNWERINHEPSIIPTPKRY